MMLKSTSKYILNSLIIAILLMLPSTIVYGQDKSESNEDTKIEKTISPSDTIPYKFGLRIGIDLAGPISSLIDSDHQLFKGNFDARVYKKYFVSGEFGYEKFKYFTENLNYTTSGSFIMLGGDIDMLGYKPGRNDLLAFGVRYGFSRLTQTVTEYKVQNGYWNDDSYIGSIGEQDAYANWINLRLGLKVEVLHNFYLGISAGVNFLFYDTELDNFDNLYIPGFGENKSSKSWVFNYTVMYLLPFN